MRVDSFWAGLDHDEGEKSVLPNVPERKNERGGRKSMDVRDRERAWVMHLGGAVQTVIFLAWRSKGRC